jgi:hypothetical protein
MKKILVPLATLLLLVGLMAVDTPAALAQDCDADGSAYGVGGYIDEDGDGFNDNAPDADGDGIPNGQDPDFVRPEDGSGNMYKNQGGLGEGNEDGFWKRWQKKLGLGDGDEGRGDMGLRGGSGGHGPGNGSGNGGSGPQDGSGNGPGSGDCDGSGPSGNGDGRR